MRITEEHRQKLLKRAIALGLNNPAVNRIATGLTQQLTLSREIDLTTFYHLLAIVERAEAGVTEHDPVGPFRPQPAEGLSEGAIRLNFKVCDTDNLLSLSEPLVAGGISGNGGLRSGKSTLAGHLLKAFLEIRKSIFGFDSKGVGEFDFLKEFPVLFLDVGKNFLFNPFTDELGSDDVMRQLDILAVCTERKDSAGLLTCAGDYFFDHRDPESESQLTLFKIYTILSRYITPANHKHLYRPQLWPSLLNVIKSILSSPLGHCMKVDNGLDLAALIRARGSVMINTSRLTLAQEEYLIASLGWKIYEIVRSGNID